MRILTLWQPWASAIALGLKQYETRSWDTKYRGKLAIHAAQRPCKVGEMTVLLEDMAECGKEPEFRQLESVVRDSKQYGAIVAIADLVSTLHMTEDKYKGTAAFCKSSNIAIGDATQLENSLGWWEQGRFAWRLRNVIALPEPILYKGGQGLRRLTDENILNPAASAVP